MSIKSLGLKVSLIVALMIIVIIVAIFFIVSAQSNTLIVDITSKEATTANASFIRDLQALQDTALLTAGIIAYSNNVVDAMIDGDAVALKAALIRYGEAVDTVMVTDTNGDVVVRKHSDQLGDNVMSQAIVSNTLSTGIGISTIAKGATVGLATRGSAVIKDYSGKVIGLVVCGHDLANPKYVESEKERTGNEYTIFDGDIRLNTTIFDENGERVIGTQASDSVVKTVIEQRSNFGSEINLFGREYYSFYSPLIIDDTVIGMLFNGVPIDGALAEQRAMINMVVTVGALCGVACIVFVIVFNIFAVSRPLKKIGAYAQKISIGDIGVSSSSSAVIDVHSSDEVGVLARALEQAYANLRGYVGEIKDCMHNLAKGDLTTESSYAFEGDFILIRDSINEIIQNLNRIMGGINASSAQVSAGSRQVADGAQTLSQGSTEQASSIEKLSGSIAAINNMAKDTTTTATEALDEVQQAGKLMGECVEKMDQMLEAMRMINEKSQSISRTTKVIDDIAFQTNILALNAAVEAARAGQHGKGFAVVAEEVRNLASKSAEAAKETETLIESSTQSVGEGSAIVQQVNESLRAVAEIAQKSAEKIASVQSYSTQQSQAMEQINIGIEQVAQIVQQNNATAEESAAASEEMSGQSAMLQQMLAQFRLKDL